MSADAKQTCFVLMPFQEPFTRYFAKIVKPAVENCGLYAVRGDSLFTPTAIMDDVWNGIRSARILIAELTGRNPNVFYELGLAHAISKPVVLIAQGIEDVPFDLRGIRVLLYDKDNPEWGEELKTKLIRAIREVMDRPLDAIPVTFKSPIHVKRPEEDEFILRLERIEKNVQGLMAESGDQFGLYQEYEDKSPAVKVGSRVEHGKFGPGKVVAMEGKGDHARVQINFDNAGMKWLMLKFANLTVVT